MNPFPLSSSDYSYFMRDVGAALGSLPSWGGIVQWQGRYILAFQKVDGTWALTDISGGIPTARGTVSVSDLLADIPRVETSSWQVFVYNLPGNLLDVATERAAQIASGAATVIDSAIRPLLPDLLPLIIAGVAVLAFMYLPRTRP